MYNEKCNTPINSMYFIATKIGKSESNLDIINIGNFLKIQEDKRETHLGKQSSKKR